MHRLIATTVAALGAASAAHAGVFAGFITSAGVARATPAVAQATTATHLRTAFLQVSYTNGATTYPEFTASGTTTVVATTGAGPCRTDIQMRVISTTKTLVTITQVGAAGAPGLKAISFGSPNSRVVYDLVATSAMTPGSDLGVVPSASTLAGDWTAQLEFVSPIALTGSAPRGDLFNTMRVNFLAPMNGGTLAFTVDTDALP
jgi:hypothetical protein